MKLRSFSETSRPRPSSPAPAARPPLMLIEDPLLKAAGKDSMPSGIPHRIIPSLAAAGTYQGYTEPGRATSLTFDILRKISDCHLVRAFLNHYIRCAQGFCRRPASRVDVGFRIELRDPEDRMSAADRREAEALTELIEQGGYMLLRRTDGQHAVWDGRGEERAVRLDQLIGMLVEDLLVYDAAALRLEIPRSPEAHPVYQANPEAIERGTPYPPVWIGPISGRRIRIAEQTYREPQGDPLPRVLPKTAGARAYKAEIRPELGEHVAYVELDERNQVRREFAWHELAYLVQRPQSDTWTVGYGRSALEYIVEAVVGLVGGVSFNVEYFTHSHIPEGILQLTGNWKQERLAQFQQELVTRVGGPGQYHRIPLLFSEDPKAAAQFLGIRNDSNMDMLWEKWISFIVTLIAGVLGTAPEVINFQGFKQTGHTLRDEDPATRLLQSSDTGFARMMLGLEAALNQHLIWRIDDRFSLRWQNLRERDEAQELTSIQNRMNLGLLTINEARRERGEEEIWDPLDRDLYRMIEREAEKTWPVLIHDVHERKRVVQQVYEHFGGSWARYPDVPGMAAVVQQVYMSEIGPYLATGGDSSAGAPGGMDALGGFGEGDEGPSALGDGSREGSFPGAEAPWGTAPSPDSNGAQDEEQARAELLSRFMPPGGDAMQKAIEGARPGALRRARRWLLRTLRAVGQRLRRSKDTHRGEL